MFKLDDDFLASVGLAGLPADQKPDMLRHIYERLELNVGMKLAEQMTDTQLDEFEGFIDRKDDAGALKWLETNFPGYKQVVAEELEKLKAEISSSAAQIVEAAVGGANMTAGNDQFASAA
jgi:predicted RNA-binding Zn ribbon-like protein